MTETIKEVNLTATLHEDKTVTITVSGNGMNALELVGLMEMVRTRLIVYSIPEQLKTEGDLFVK